MNILLLSFKIFFARILDVALGTIKTVYIVKEKRIISSIIAFIEVFIWFVVAKEALNTNVDSIYIPIAYSAGYSIGTYIGTLISSKFIKGHFTINVISSKINKKDIENLKKAGFGVSIINMENNKKYLIIEIDKRSLKKFNNLIKKIDKNAFIMINETKIVYNGYIN